MSNNPKTDELPTVAQRRVGAEYLRRYAHMVADDPAFMAACVYRMMMLAKLRPDAPELADYWKAAAHAE